MKCIRCGKGIRYCWRCKYKMAVPRNATPENCDKPLCKQCNFKRTDERAAGIRSEA